MLAPVLLLNVQLNSYPFHLTNSISKKTTKINSEILVDLNKLFGNKQQKDAQFIHIVNKAAKTVDF